MACTTREDRGRKTIQETGNDGLSFTNWPEPILPEPRWHVEIWLHRLVYRSTSIVEALHVYEEVGTRILRIA